MDQIKIGKFIAACRKEQKLTQLQLADRLGITDKAVSKWERGIAMPDTSIMLDLCEILEINVNELLSGEKITMENKHQKNEGINARSGEGDRPKEQNHLDDHVGHSGGKYVGVVRWLRRRILLCTGRGLAGGIRYRNRHPLLGTLFLRVKAGGQRGRL